jgi:cytochrome c556
MKKLAVMGLLAACTTLATPSFAQFQKPEDAIKYRQSLMFILAQHFGRVGAMANGRVPFDANTAMANADVVATMGRLHLSGFGPGTEGGKTKVEAWKDVAKFKEYSDVLASETGKLSAAAKTGSLDNLKTAFGATAGTCKTCHDAFRSQ